MRVPLLAIAAASFSFADTALGQDGNGAAQCQALQQKAPYAVVFIVYPGATDPISRDEFAPTQLQSTGNVAFRVCVPINPQQDGTRGAVNVKIQVYSTAPNAGANAAKNRAVEYENNTDHYAAALAAFRKRRASSTAYPSLDIQDYQNYHGCTQPRRHAIDSEFHLQVGDRRTNDDPYRARFVFRRDVQPTCDVPTLVAEFLGELPSVGPSFAGITGRYDPRVESIVGRRSIILRYDYQPAPAGTVYYLAHDLMHVGKDNCVRIEASQIFESRLSSDVVGVACVAAPN
jgi:hypothetical protein